MNLPPLSLHHLHGLTDATGIPGGQAGGGVPAQRGPRVAFLLTKQIAGCTQATLRTYRWWLDRMLAGVLDVTALLSSFRFLRLLRSLHW